ncbi:MAG: hypothetical protein AVDCRST_MAG29-1998, partial [uncultured Nocardioidaceae bacterium]
GAVGRPPGGDARGGGCLPALLHLRGQPVHPSRGCVLRADTGSRRRTLRRARSRSTAGGMEGHERPLPGRRPALARRLPHRVGRLRRVGAGGGVAGGPARRGGTRNRGDRCRRREWHDVAAAYRYRTRRGHLGAVGRRQRRRGHRLSRPKGAGAAGRSPAPRL